MKSDQLKQFLNLRGTLLRERAVLLRRLAKIDRAIGSTAFAYSDSMKAKGGKWDYAQMNAFLANPKGVVAGTKMSYAGEKDAAKRADIILYLRSLASNPAPLPAP